MNKLIKQYEDETGRKAIYRVDNSTDCHTLKYVEWLERKVERLKTESLPDVSSRFCIGEYIRIKRDTTKFLKENNYWLEEYDLAGINNIDGMTGIIKGDYTDLKGDESHYVVALVNIDMSGIGIHPDYIMGC